MSGSAIFGGEKELRRASLRVVTGMGGLDGPDPERAGTEWPFTTHRQARLPELPHPGLRSRLHP